MNIQISLVLVEEVKHLMIASYVKDASARCFNKQTQQQKEECGFYATKQTTEI